MKITNPVLKIDMPDMDVIKSNGYYYMVSTTMFFSPGAPILRSKDLKNWEIVSYVFDKIEYNDIYQLKNGKNAYGKGQWATTLQQRNGKYYACFASNDMQKTYIYYTDDIEKSFWDRYVVEGLRHDSSFLFIDEKAYLVYGNGDIHIVEFKDDLSGFKEETDHILFSTDTDGIMLRCEGCRAYVRNGFIYLSFIEWPKEGVGHFRRRQICYRSKSLDTPFERKIIYDDDMNYNNCGIAQGVFIDSDEDEGFAMLFQDHGAVGRIPYLIPMKWENDWPVIGIDGCTPESFDISVEEAPAKPLIISDSFNHSKNELPLQFQWNHNPIADGWSFTEREGYLRLKNLQLANSLLEARNTLTERTITPKSVFTIEGDFSKLLDGDYAGLAAFMGRYGTVGVLKEDGAYFICHKRFDGFEEKIPVSNIDGFSANNVWFKILFDFENQDKAFFYYSVNGTDFYQIGEALDMQFTLDLFVGYRIGVFSYGTKELGGVADFSNLEFSV